MHETKHNAETTRNQGAWFSTWTRWCNDL